MSDSCENCQPTSRNCMILQRWVIMFLGFLGNFNALSMRVCLSMAITEMTSTNNSKSDSELETKNYLNSIKYDWSERTQGLVLSSFYWGYAISSVFGGAICQKIGGKRALSMSILFTSVFTILTPYCIFWGGSTALIVLRVAIGFVEGISFPAVIQLLAHWIPADERSKAGSVVFSGNPFGIIFGMFVAGMILQYSKSGWPMVFYVYGIIGLISFLLNTAFCYNRPSENPYISHDELSYLNCKLNNTQTSLPTTPWRHLLKSKALWASVIAKTGINWGYVAMLSDMPKYMSSVLKISARDNGYLLSMPHLSMWIFSYIASWVFDKLIAEGRFSITTTRKLGCAAASLGPAIFLVAASYAGSDALLVVTLQSIGVGLLACHFCSVLINALDLSPNYASSIMGLSNGFATFISALSPYVAGVLTPNQTVDEWRLVFWIVGAIFVSSAVVFSIYGSGEVQEWNDPAFTNREKNSDGVNLEKVVELVPLN